MILFFGILVVYGVAVIFQHLLLFHLIPDRTRHLKMRFGGRGIISFLSNAALFGRVDILLIVGDCLLFYNILFNSSRDYAASNGAFQWTALAWLSLIKVTSLYFLRANEYMEMTTARFDLTLFMPPALFCMLMIRSRKQLFGGKGASVSVESLFHTDIIFHVVLDLCDLIITFHMIRNSRQLDGPYDLIRPLNGGFMCVAWFLHSYSFPSGTSRAISPLSQRLRSVDLTNGPTSHEGDGGSNASTRAVGLSNPAAIASPNHTGVSLKHTGDTTFVNSTLPNLRMVSTPKYSGATATNAQATSLPGPGDPFQMTASANIVENDIFLTRKHVALVSLFLVDTPLFVCRTLIWVGFPLSPGLQPFLFKNVVCIPVSIFALAQCRRVERQIQNAAAGSGPSKAAFTTVRTPALIPSPPALESGPPEAPAPPSVNYSPNSPQRLELPNSPHHYHRDQRARAVEERADRTTQSRTTQTALRGAGGGALSTAYPVRSSSDPSRADLPPLGSELVLGPRRRANADIGKIDDDDAKLNVNGDGNVGARGFESARAAGKYGRQTMEGDTGRKTLDSRAGGEEGGEARGAADVMDSYIGGERGVDGRGALVGGTGDGGSGQGKEVAGESFDEAMSILLNVRSVPIRSESIGRMFHSLWRSYVAGRHFGMPARLHFLPILARAQLVRLIAALMFDAAATIALVICVTIFFKDAFYYDEDGNLAGLYSTAPQREFCKDRSEVCMTFMDYFPHIFAAFVALIHAGLHLSLASLPYIFFMACEIFLSYICYALVLHSLLIVLALNLDDMWKSVGSATPTPSTTHPLFLLLLPSTFRLIKLTFRLTAIIRNKVFVSYGGHRALTPQNLFSLKYPRLKGNEDEDVPSQILEDVSIQGNSLAPSSGAHSPLSLPVPTGSPRTTPQSPARFVQAAAGAQAKAGASVSASVGKTNEGGVEDEGGDRGEMAGNGVGVDDVEETPDAKGLVSISGLVILNLVKKNLAPLSYNRLLMHADVVKSIRLCDVLLTRDWSRLYFMFLLYGVSLSIMPRVMSLVLFTLHIASLFISSLMSQAIRLLTLRQYELRATLRTKIIERARHAGLLTGKADPSSSSATGPASGPAFPYFIRQIDYTDYIRSQGYFTSPGEIFPPTL